MKNLRNFLMILSLAAVSVFVACGDDDPEPCNWGQDLADEANALSAAATTYANNPTTANCEAYKDAYQDYLDEAEDHIDCARAAGQEQELRDAIDQAQDQLDALQC